jgi:hypothetical protein
MVQPIKEYLTQLIILNSQTTIPDQTGGNGILQILKSFGYPIYIFMEGSLTPVHILLIGLSSVFILIAGYRGIVLKKTKEIIFILIILGFAGIRVIVPGTELYAGYRMITWYSLFIMIILFLLENKKTFERYKWMRTLSYFIIALSVIFVLLNPKSYLFDKVDRYQDFSTSYGRQFVNGEVVRILSSGHDTLFVDGYDVLMFWQAGIASSYPYTFYFSLFDGIDKYENLRVKMFEQNPPDFYFKECVAKNTFALPKFALSQYKELKNKGSHTCLFIRKEKIPEISEDQWARAKAYGFSL